MIFLKFNGIISSKNARKRLLPFPPINLAEIYLYSFFDLKIIFNEK
jgi:hypothetical protein